MEVASQLSNIEIPKVRNHSQIGQHDDSGLAPFPEGWFYVTDRKTLEKEKLIAKTCLGQNLIIWCDDKGNVCVAEAICPHLGSDLRPDAGACVKDGNLVCPFHGFRYDASGLCVATPFAPPPRDLKLNVHEVREIQGLIFAWFGMGGRPPQFEIPEPQSTETDWSEKAFWSVKFVGHPQETTENSVDLMHLRYVHGYDNVYGVGSVDVDGATLRTNIDFKRKVKIAGVNYLSSDNSISITVHGLGYSLVEIRENSIGVTGLFWVLATPIDGRNIEMTAVNQIKMLRNPKKFFVGLRFLPVGLRTRLINRLMHKSQQHDILQDVDIWTRKQYRTRPILCRADGEIYKFRRYCEQFYPNRSDDRVSEIR